VSHLDLLQNTAPLPANAVQVPVVRQRQNFSCGAAVTLTLLRYWCVEPYARVEEEALYASLSTTDARGTEPEPMVALLNRGGVDARYRHGDVTIGDLERAVDAQEPPIVDLQAWREHDAPWREIWDAGHYVMMVGYDRERLFFADPSNLTPEGYAFLLRDELDERWHDLSGERDERLVRMTIFARGKQRCSSGALPREAVRLG
jgi:predicted double-glycine peptidase